jgi:DNA-binding GntR family transcriptional regulator
MPNENPRASDRIEQEIRRLITTLEIPPGTMIREVDLTQRLGCSRTPLREALQRLAQEYLVVAVPRRGMIVAELSLLDYVQLIEALAHIEGAAAGLAADRSSGEELDGLEQTINHAREANLHGEYFTVTEADFEFHRAIAGLTRNRYLLDTTVRLHRLASPFSFLALKRGENAELSIGEHRQLLAAIRRRDSALARRLTFDHTVRTKDRIIATL